MAKLHVPEHNILTCDRCGATAKFLEDDIAVGWRIDWVILDPSEAVDLCSDCADVAADRVNSFLGEKGR